MKNFKFRIYENNYNVRIISHEDNIIDLEVNGTSYSVKLKEEVKVTKTPTLVRSSSKRPAELIKSKSKFIKLQKLLHQFQVLYYQLILKLVMKLKLATDYLF